MEFVFFRNDFLSVLKEFPSEQYALHTGVRKTLTVASNLLLALENFFSADNWIDYSFSVYLLCCFGFLSVLFLFCGV